jgi:hypothetical protein
MTKGWKPDDPCLKETCTGIFIPNKDLKGSWICNVCGLEILDNDDPEPEEKYTGIVHDNMIIQSVSSQKPYISRCAVQGAIAPGGSSSGKRRKKKPKPDLMNRYRDIR